MDDPLHTHSHRSTIRQWRISRLMVFIEVPAFTAIIKKLMTDTEYAGLQEALVAQPELGKLIPGSGGLRKVRWGVKGRGKRGGARVVYFYLSSDQQIFMLAAYSKSQKVDLSADDLARLRMLSRVMQDG